MSCIEKKIFIQLTAKQNSHTTAKVKEDIRRSPSQSVATVMLGVETWEWWNTHESSIDLDPPCNHTLGSAHGDTTDHSHEKSTGYWLRNHLLNATRLQPSRCSTWLHTALESRSVTATATCAPFIPLFPRLPFVPSLGGAFWFHWKDINRSTNRKRGGLRSWKNLN